MLSFKNSKTTSYVTNRRSVTYYPQGSDIYSTNGIKLLEFQISGNDWLDPTTFRIMFVLINTDATANHNLRLTGGPWSFFQRMRVLCGGAILEDLDMYHRTHEMMSIFNSTRSRDNDIAEGFSNPWETAVSANSVSPISSWNSSESFNDCCV